LNYLVTGVCGFIASKVTEMLLDQENRVVGVDNINDAYDVRLKQWRLKRLANCRNFEFHQADICDRLLMESIVKSHEFDAVINLAARAGVRQSLENPWIYLETNCTGTLNLLELARIRGIRKFVLASTSSLYGAHKVMPYSEDGDTSHPLSPYAASKKAAEALCYSYHRLYRLDISVLRYFTVYGPACRPDMSIFRFVQRISESRPVAIFGDGQQSRDFTYVDDIARGTIAALRPVGYGTFNLGSDRPYILMDVVKIVEEMVGKSAHIQYRPVHPGDVPATWADIRRANDVLAWAPTVSLEEGLSRVVEWYKQNQSWAREINTDEQSFFEAAAR